MDDTIGSVQPSKCNDHMRAPTNFLTVPALTKGQSVDSGLVGKPLTPSKPLRLSLTAAAWYFPARFVGVSR